MNVGLLQNKKLNYFWFRLECTNHAPQKVPEKIKNAWNPAETIVGKSFLVGIITAIMQRARRKRYVLSFIVYPPLKDTSLF